MRVRERILAKFWRASRAEFNSRARSLYGIGATFQIFFTSLKFKHEHSYRWRADADRDTVVADLSSNKHLLSHIPR